MLVKRRKTKEIRIGDVKLGGNNPIRVQSMCNTKTKDIDATIKQIHSLEETGCELIRIAVPDIESVKKIKKIKQQINIPLIADVHYDYKLALESLKQGVDKIRINPGNIPEDELKLIVKEAKDADKPIRIGINIGSLPKNITQKLGFTSEAMFKAALDTVDTFENLDFRNIVVSLKSSDIFQTIEANRLFSEKSDYPLHIGITEAGTIKSGIAKSSIGLGYLLIKGIGDTIRVSLLEDSLQEVRIARDILSSLDIRKFGPNYICCPTCGRCEVDLRKKAQELMSSFNKLNHNSFSGLSVALMGCMVNGPGEAKHADIGIAFG